jgi:hypothetical protein
MSDRLSHSEIFPSLKSRAIAFARASLRLIESIDTRVGERDYETHMRGKVDCHLLLAGLLLETPKIGSEHGVSVSGDADAGLNSISEGITAAVTALQLSDRLLFDCKSRRSHVEEARELMETSCREMSALLAALHQSGVSVSSAEASAISRRICSRVMN